MELLCKPSKIHSGKKISPVYFSTHSHRLRPVVDRALDPCAGRAILRSDNHFCRRQISCPSDFRFRLREQQQRRWFPRQALSNSNARPAGSPTERCNSAPPGNLSWRHFSREHRRHRSGSHLDWRHPGRTTSGHQRWRWRISSQPSALPRLGKSRSHRRDR